MLIFIVEPRVGADGGYFVGLKAKFDTAATENLVRALLGRGESIGLCRSYVCHGSHKASLIIVTISV